MPIYSKTVFNEDVLSNTIFNKNFVLPQAEISRQLRVGYVLGYQTETE